VYGELLVETIATFLLLCPLFIFYTTSLKNYRNEIIIIASPHCMHSVLCENTSIMWLPVVTSRLYVQWQSVFVVRWAVFRLYKNVVPFDCVYMCVFGGIPMGGTHGFLFVSKMSLQSSWHSSMHITLNYILMLCVSRSDHLHTFCVNETRSVHGESLTTRQYQFLSLSTHIIF